MITWVTVWVLTVQYVGSNGESHGFTQIHRTEQVCSNHAKQAKTGILGKAFCIKTEIPVVTK